MSHVAVRLTTIAVCAALSGASVAHASGGGAEVPMPPTVQSVACVPSPNTPCASKRAVVRGGTVRIRGGELGEVREVVFEGGRSRGDDVAVRPTERADTRLQAVVPTRAQSGPVAVIDSLGRRARSPRKVKVVSPPPIDVAPGSGFYFAGKRKPSLTFTADRAAPVVVEVVRKSDGAVVRTVEVQAEAGENTARWNGSIGGKPAASAEYVMRLASGAQASARASASFALFDHLFPIRGKHNLGYTNTNQFGGGRGHQGIDMFANCGTKLAIARGGRVQYAGYHSAAGNYAVIDGAGTGTDYIYMHMRDPALVRTGQRVFTGQKLGLVGDTGRATGCHLHFEMWASPGWYEGGQPFDPRPQLKRWETYKP